MHHRRRALLFTSLIAALPLGAARPAAAAPAIRVGTLRFGSVAWELDVMRTHGLDTAAGVMVEPVEFAAAQATQVALQAGRVDMIVQDWLWVSRQRASGADWTLSPTSGALGAVMAPPASPVQAVADLRGRRLGIAGSPLDKSWPMRSSGWAWTWIRPPPRPSARPHCSRSNWRRGGWMPC